MKMVQLGTGSVLSGPNQASKQSSIEGSLLARLVEHVKSSLGISQLVTLVYPIKGDVSSSGLTCDEALICQCHCTERL